MTDATSDPQGDVEVQQAQALGDSVLLLDVREPHEWAAGHAPGAVHLPMGAITLEAVPTDRPVVCVCRSGNRSHHASRALAEHGVQAVNMLGGMQAWASAGLPMEADGDADPVVA